MLCVGYARFCHAWHLFLFYFLFQTKEQFCYSVVNLPFRFSNWSLTNFCRHHFVLFDIDQFCKTCNICNLFSFSNIYSRKPTSIYLYTLRLVRHFVTEKYYQEIRTWVLVQMVSWCFDVPIYFWLRVKLNKFIGNWWHILIYYFFYSTYLINNLLVSFL